LKATLSIDPIRKSLTFLSYTLAGSQNLIGEKVRSLRVALDWSQEKLAGKCQLQGWDVIRATISKVEAGLRRVIDAELLVLAKALKVPMDKLFPDCADVMEVLRNPD
jgi:transcriptional regulator with XRE-family HTH domain